MEECKHGTAGGAAHPAHLFRKEYIYLAGAAGIHRGNMRGSHHLCNRHRVINQLIKIGAIFLGIRFIVPKGAENGVSKGALLGLIYMGVGVLIYALLSGQKLTLMGYVIDLLMGVAAGGLSGMILGSMSRK